LDVTMYRGLNNKNEVCLINATLPLVDYGG